MSGQMARFSAWDGSQNPWDDDEDALFDQLSEDVFHGWDVESALRRLLGRGWRSHDGASLQGLEETMDQLRRLRTRQLERYNLDSIFDDLLERIDNIVRMERQAFRERLDNADEGARPLVEKVVRQRTRTLDELPAEPSAALSQLREYEFLDPGAEQAFASLLEEMDKTIRDTYFAGMSEQLRNMGAGDVTRMKQMTRDLNALVRKRLEGVPEEQIAADYTAFTQRYADIFPDAPATFDEFLEQMQQRMAQLDSLMQSLSDEQRRELADLAGQALGDPELQSQLAELMAALELLSPRQTLGNRYGFFGDQRVGLEEAMRIVGGLQSMEQLERELRGVYRGEQLSDDARRLLDESLGQEARAGIDRISEMLRRLEERGLVDRDADGMRLTAKGMRKIGHKALRDLFAHLARDRFGEHPVADSGSGTERGDENKVYEFGDPFDLDVNATIRESVRRRSLEGDEARLRPGDFIVHRREAATSAATVLLLDMSRSMPLRGYFYAAKKVAMALDSLIRSQYPRDALSIIGFSDYAREIAPSALPHLSVNEYVYGTNLQHGLILARKFLKRHRGATKQIIIVSDGEPTAHLEDGHAVFFYPPLPETFQKTLSEVRRCTAEDIVINTFMLESNHHLVEFVNRMTQLNRGRAFFISPDRLGDYILVDYVKTRRHAA